MSQHPAACPVTIASRETVPVWSGYFINMTGRGPLSEIYVILSTSYMQPEGESHVERVCRQADRS